MSEPKNYAEAVDWLNEASAEIAALQAELAKAQAELASEQARADRLFKDRYDLLNATTTGGMSASEWQMRTATAERRAREAEAELAKAQAQLAVVKERLDGEPLPGSLAPDLMNILSTTPDVMAVVDTTMHERNDLPYYVDSSGLWLTCRVPGKYPMDVRVVVLRKEASDGEA